MPAEDLEQILELASNAIAHQLSVAGIAVGDRRLVLVAYEYEEAAEGGVMVGVREVILGLSGDVEAETQLAAKVLRESADSLVERGRRADLRFGPGGS